MTIIKNSPGSVINGYGIFFRILGIIFVSEFLVMTALWFIDMPSGLYEFILDSVMLSVLSAPFLYIAVVRVVVRKLHTESLYTQTAREKEIKAQAQAENLAAKAYADNIVKSVQSGLVVVTSDFYVVWVNPAFSSMFSLKAEEVEGRRIDDIFPLGDLKEAIRDAFRNGKESEDNVLETSSQGNRYFRIPESTAYYMHAGLG